ncbi:MAG TPA: hypothetical protein VFF79_01530 [Conexibacter sp.]|nr:hypothetical protein [Conexibacter sp.]
MTVALVGLLAAFTMAVTAASSSANALSVDNNRFRITWARLRFFEVGGAINSSIRCPVTWEGSFHVRTIFKFRGVLAGYITRTRVTTEACSETGIPAEARFHNERLPWHMIYQGFVGTLPNISHVRFMIREVAFTLTPANLLVCEYDSELEGEQFKGEFIREAGGKINSFEPDPTSLIEFIGGEVFCSPAAALEFVGQVFVLGSTTERISLRLI